MSDPNVTNDPNVDPNVAEPTGESTAEPTPEQTTEVPQPTQPTGTVQDTTATNNTGPDAGQLLNPEENTGKTDEQVAAEVLAGQWGRGRGRAHRLALAGYDPGLVRAAVARQLRGEKTVDEDQPVDANQ